MLAGHLALIIAAAFFGAAQCRSKRHRASLGEARRPVDAAFAAAQQKKDAAKAAVTCAVSIGPREGGGFGIAVKLRVEDKSLPQAELAALVKQAHEQICPYSHATRGNIEVLFETLGA